MGLVERGERHPERGPGARGIALGAGAEGGKSAIKLDTRAEEQRVALERRESEDLAEALQGGGLASPVIFGEGGSAGSASGELSSQGVCGSASRRVPFQGDAHPFQRRHEISLVGAVPCLSRLPRRWLRPSESTCSNRYITGCDCSATRRQHRARRASGRMPDRSPRAGSVPGARTRVWSGLPYLRIQEKG